ncbi:MAG: hypothetical protein DRJ31_07460 [Candidatus Methanomethylicota archaeon]|uniref:DUF541 domain-containing protein n=1 Tax=Thermoproteota archaeon TaxID=2056631 RepID=A0A497EM08_9CREN|nr:MAG: hypothetical protein DRJ31_07460 [Candidatus Verstraetearchaeota archaeon]
MLRKQCEWFRFTELRSKILSIGKLVLTFRLILFHKCSDLEVYAVEAAEKGYGRILFTIVALLLISIALSIASLALTLQSQGTLSEKQLSSSAKLGLPSSLAQAIQSALQTKTITVTGEGEASAPPEIAVVKLSVETFRENASDAQKENFEITSRVINMLKQAGIAEDQIETTSFSLTPIYEYSYGSKYGETEKTLVGYRCVNSIKVTLENISMVGEVIDIAIAAGANRVSSVSFSLRDETVKALQLQALANAVSSAYSKATAIAEALGVSLKEPLTISTSTYYVPRLYFDVEVAAVGKPSITPPSELSVSASVTITYSFE